MREGASSPARLSSKVPRVLRVQELDLQALAQQHSILGQLIAQEQDLQPPHNSQQQQHEVADASGTSTRGLQPSLKRDSQQHQQHVITPSSPATAAAEARGAAESRSTPAAAAGASLPPVADMDTEQLVAQLFDAELQERLQRAAAPSQVATSRPVVQQQQQQQEEERERAPRPGMSVPTAAEALHPLPPRLAEHVPAWAPLPPAQLERWVGGPWGANRYSVLH